MLTRLAALLRATWSRLTHGADRGQGPVDLLALAGLVGLACLAVTAALAPHAGMPSMP